MAVLEGGVITVLDAFSEMLRWPTEWFLDLRNGFELKMIDL